MHSFIHPRYAVRGGAKDESHDGAHVDAQHGAHVQSRVGHGLARGQLTMPLLLGCALWSFTVTMGVLVILAVMQQRPDSAKLSNGDTASISQTQRMWWVGGGAEASHDDDSSTTLETGLVAAIGMWLQIVWHLFGAVGVLTRAGVWGVAAHLLVLLYSCTDGGGKLSSGGLEVRVDDISSNGATRMEKRGGVGLQRQAGQLAGQQTEQQTEQQVGQKLSTTLTDPGVATRFPPLVASVLRMLRRHLWLSVFALGVAGFVWRAPQSMLYSKSGSQKQHGDGAGQLLGDFLDPFGTKVAGHAGVHAEHNLAALSTLGSSGATGGALILALFVAGLFVTHYGQYNQHRDKSLADNTYVGSLLWLPYRCLGFVYSAAGEALFWHSTKVTLPILRLFLDGPFWWYAMLWKEWSGSRSPDGKPVMEGVYIDRGTVLERPGRLSAALGLQGLCVPHSLLHGHRYGPHLDERKWRDVRAGW